MEVQLAALQAQLAAALRREAALRAQLLAAGLQPEADEEATAGQAGWALEEESWMLERADASPWAARVSPRAPPVAPLPLPHAVAPQEEEVADVQVGWRGSGGVCCVIGLMMVSSSCPLATNPGNATPATATATTPVTTTTAISTTG